MTINGHAIDFSALSEGDEGTHPLIVGEAKRIDGGIHLTIMSPYGDGGNGFPDPIIDPPNGDIEV